MNQRERNKDSTITDFNYGWAILRTWMCFQVLLCHFWHTEKYGGMWQPLISMRDYAVSVFMLLSFILTADKFVEAESSYIKSRIWRLVYPLVGWTFIYYIVYSCSEMLFHIQILDGWQDFVWQLFTGHRLHMNPVMWYQVDTLIITGLFFFVMRICERKTGFILIGVIGIIALALQYSGINRMLFSDLPYELQYPIGRIAEMLPYCSIGIFLGYYHVFSKLDKFKYIIGVIAAVFFLFLLGYKTRVFVPQGFGYSGIWGILIALSLIFAFSGITIRNVRIAKWIKQGTNYTMGIYCMHNLIGNMYCQIFNTLGIEKGAFGLCIMIYITCYFVAFVMVRIPFKLCRQLVR